ncbi:hypothetical protein ACWGJ9_07290 [Curtobacterium citreum]
MKLIVDLGDYHPDCEDSQLRSDAITALAEYDFPVQDVTVLR